MAEQIFSDIKVLDLTWHITGPYATKIFADFGADVLKIERPGGGDPARQMGPFLNDDPHPEKSLLFSHLNLNKRGTTLNLKTTLGKSIFKELVKDVDLLVESFSPGVMDRLGLDYETLKEINPGLVMTSISNYGQTGPYRDFKMSELVLNGIGHDQFSCGVPDRYPLKLGGNVLQYQSGQVVALATLGALWAQKLQGISQHLDISIQETMAGTTDRKTINLLCWAYSGAPTMPRSDRRAVIRTILPSGMYQCKDGFLNCLTPVHTWDRLVRLLGDPPELKENFKWPEDIYDLDRKWEVDQYWVPWCAERTKVEAMAECQKYKVFATAVMTPKDVVESKHFAERGFWVEVEHPVTGKQTYPGAPVKMPEAPWQLRMPAPLLGQHNQEVYCDRLGYSKQDLVRLREAGII